MPIREEQWLGLSTLEEREALLRSVLPAEVLLTAVKRSVHSSSAAAASTSCAA